MKQLSRFQSIVFAIGGIMMAIGAGLFSFMIGQKVACIIFFVGTIAFTLMQASQTYEGNSLTVKRLKRIQAFANLMFIVAAILMVDTAYGFLMPLFADGKTSGTGYITYIELVYNKWVLPLLIAAILEVYTVHRLDSELKKEE